VIIKLDYKCRNVTNCVTACACCLLAILMQGLNDVCVRVKIGFMCVPVFYIGSYL